MILLKFYSHATFLYIFMNFRIKKNFSDFMVYVKLKIDFKFSIPSYAYQAISTIYIKLKKTIHSYDFYLHTKAVWTMEYTNVTFSFYEQRTLNERNVTRPQNPYELWEI